MLLAVAGRGDMLTVWPEQAQILGTPTAVGQDRSADDGAYLRIEVPGDTIYETEIDQPNFWHVFGGDLNTTLGERVADRPRQSFQALRSRRRNFQDQSEEKSNIELVNAFNRRLKGSTGWTEQDFRSVHTIGVFLSGHEKKEIPVLKVRPARPRLRRSPSRKPAAVADPRPAGPRD